MWRLFTQWQKQMDQDAILVLDNPDALAAIPAGHRHFIAARLAAMTPIERMELRDFIVRYGGARFNRMVLKLLAVFSLFGLALHLFQPEKTSWIEGLVLSNLVGISMAMGLMGAWFNYRKLVGGKLVKSVLIMLFACLFGLLIGMGMAAMVNDKPYVFDSERLLRIVGIAWLVAGLLYIIPVGIVAIWRNQQHDATTLRLQQAAERERMARELSDSQLRLLRAQIEPHFLFNTLGAVQQLAEQGAPRAAALTADLIAFLRASLAEMRSEQVPLQSEFDMVEAYLRVMQARMGQRLDFSLALPPELAHTMVPSMIVLTLAENAIKHGIEPALRGGDIHISAQLAGAMLRLRVEDTGVGLSEHAAPVAGSGLGLENVRSRLQLVAQQDGVAAGSLEVRNGDAGGVIADIVLPFQAGVTGKTAALMEGMA
ncbi:MULTISPECIES: sensor histidine kinase [unclassified Janthinobacterium]|uniref:sensor histidine kinase n=1 Tax=unclassified Janthinobacterium TaxID=2610881 RepID=UPI00160EDEE6|nr:MULTISPECIES: histidine kinase [unclassified Janthinobacterium]MBB5607290.1 signal transduction histidine kinase [Janthinobacterium sp. S3T4]MBB5615425.1 signal transduction histidine kinase [Janthinobacterium sp. S3M3]